MEKKAKDLSTEERIKAAARTLFTRKGYAATRTRDIAKEAGINLALLNYYYRSKEKLFDLVILENFGQFVEGVRAIMNEQTTSLEEKIEGLVNLYIGKLLANPDLPLFILNEMRSNPKTLKSKGLTKDMLRNSHFMKQLTEELILRRKLSVNPIHFVMNTLAMTVFPFAAAPLLKEVSGMSEEVFVALMEERRKLIPVWIKKIMQP
ncbi:MAG: TetR family transcriptional regulator [Bacteroidota bacterium]|nr:TetR family transcriptional regulator [Bacteroidota bacterium]MDP4215011.1 TetR family transcriptional regulator [Bacteroidota bacterium]MDP4244241.1 TetR family transcriptional regulator [Bacteroidota bacterium]MDP4255976.1 TetR family transcriptional regulator [Bacteroidota bacterium]MDP4257012.1 TetR family transcriptional regulator [Bacteroidota bacterium]